MNLLFLYSLFAFKVEKSAYDSLFGFKVEKSALVCIDYGITSGTKINSLWNCQPYQNQYYRLVDYPSNYKKNNFLDTY